VLHGSWVKYWVVILAIIGVIFLSACSGGYATDDVASAIDDGVIMPMGRTVWEPDFDLVQVQRGNMERTEELLAQAWFPVTWELTFDGHGGIYSGAYIEAGTMVSEGDLLGQQFLQESAAEALNITRYRLALQISTFEENFRSENTARTTELQEARRAAAMLDSHEREIANLRIARLELQHEHFIFQSQQARQRIQHQIDETDNQLAGMRIYAPFDGILTAASMMASGTEVPPGYTFFAIADTRYVHFTVTAPHHMVVRPGTVHTIWDFNNQFSFEARVMSWQPSERIPAPGSLEVLIDYLLVPEDMAVLAEMLAALDITTSDLIRMDLRITATQILASDVLLLPGRAIRREDLAYYVMVYKDGRLAKRYITRGLLHQFYVEILIGVEEGWEVALP